MLSLGQGEGEGSPNAEAGGESAADSQKKRKSANPSPRGGKKKKALALKNRPREVALDDLGKEVTPEGSLAFELCPFDRSLRRAHMIFPPPHRSPPFLRAWTLPR